MRLFVHLSAITFLAACGNADAAPAQSASVDSDGPTPVATAIAADTDQELPAVVVYKSPTCGCCNGWIEHLRAAGFEVEAYLPYGAFPAYFYVFCGAAFKVLRGRGLNLNRAVIPYFAGELALAPALLFERWLNLAMQTVVLRRP